MPLWSLLAKRGPSVCAKKRSRSWASVCLVATKMVLLSGAWVSESERSVFARRFLEGSRNAASTTSEGAMQVDISDILRTRYTQNTICPHIKGNGYLFEYLGLF